MESTEIPLQQLCSFQSGFTPRGQLTPDDNGIRAITIGTLPSLGALESKDVFRYSGVSDSERFQVRPGDILIRTRNFESQSLAVPAPFDLDISPVAVLPLVILRPDLDRVNSGYLVWALNRESTKRRLREGAQGTTVQAIRRSDLAALPIPLPPLQTQSIIGELAGLNLRRRLLIDKLGELEADLLESRLIQFVEPPAADPTHPRSAQ